MRRRAFAALLAAVCLLLCSCESEPDAQVTTINYDKGEAHEWNPYKGFAAWAKDDEKRNMNFSLVYVDMTWDELEPTKGSYDFQALEEKNHFELWKSSGKKAVFRVVLDRPGDEQHMNIPQWLYDLTGDGSFYDISYGKGYCPDYGSEILIKEHRRLLEALAERYGSDGFLAYLELGSLGHWGEWHIHEDVGQKLSPEIYEKYLSQYIELFPGKKLLTRRPFKMAAENGMGLYNDSFALEGETRRFITWINEGGDYREFDGALVPAPDAWTKAPIGGEISSSIDRIAALDEEADNIADVLRQLHVTFIGPTNWLSKELDEEQLKRERQISDALGYDFYVRSLTIRSGEEGRECSLQLCNDGCAPLYFPYDIAIKTGSLDKERTLDADITGLLPGGSLELDFTIPTDADSLWIALKNSDTDGIFLSNDTERAGFWQKLF